MLLNCRLSFFSAHTLPESPLWLNRFIHCTNVQQLPLAVRNNCNCLSFAPLSLGFNLAPRSSLHNVFVLEDAASCSQQGVLVFFSPPFFPLFFFLQGLIPQGTSLNHWHTATVRWSLPFFLRASRLRSRWRGEFGEKRKESECGPTFHLHILLRAHFCALAPR